MVDDQRSYPFRPLHNLASPASARLSTSVLLFTEAAYAHSCCKSRCCCNQALSSTSPKVPREPTLTGPVLHPISIPPFTFSTCPVIYDASSDARKLTAFAT